MIRLKMPRILRIVSSIECILNYTLCLTLGNSKVGGLLGKFEIALQKSYMIIIINIYKQ